MRIRTPPARALLLPVLLLAACGGGDDAAPPATLAQAPRLAPAVAERLAARSDTVAQKLAAGDVCGAAHDADALQADVVAAVNAGEVPGAYQEDLVARANELVDTVNCEDAAPVEETETAEAETEKPATSEKGEQPKKKKKKGKGE